MYQKYRIRLQDRIKLMDVSALLMVLLIITLVFGFLCTVVKFEYFLKTQPSVISAFHNEVWRLRDTITNTEKNIEYIKNDKFADSAMKANGFNSNVSALNESLKTTSGRLEELTKAVNQNQGKLIDSYLNEKRILFVFSGLFIAYLVKLFSGLYKYNAYVKAHYLAVLDALDLSMSDCVGSDRIDLARFNELLTSLSVKDLRIDQGGSLLEGLIQKK